MPIIIEGPDGAGKSTLVNQLVRQFAFDLQPRHVISSTGGPQDNLGQWVFQQLTKWDSFPGVARTWLYDRHPYISEGIYGSLLRGKLDPTLTVLDPRYYRMFQQMSQVIICMPPLDVVRKNVGQEDQMEGVVNYIDTIYSLYESYILTHDCIVYDYTAPDSYSRLVQALISYMMKG